MAEESRERILEILGGIDRSGVDTVIAYLNSSSYFKRGNYGHHKEYGGLATHSLEVYDYMTAHAGDLPKDSIAVAALFHDLGKTRRHVKGGHNHGLRSLDILDECGFPLTEDEHFAIGQHHSKSIDFVTHPLRRTLSMGDIISTRRWKCAHVVCTALVHRWAHRGGYRHGFQPHGAGRHF